MNSVYHIIISHTIVERANRTLRNALNKVSGSIKNKLSRVVTNYNNTIHRGIGMKPKDALLMKNRNIVKEKSMEYEREFQKIHKKLETFVIGENVLIKNEIKKNEFDKKGKIISCLHENVYLVKM
jgi:hypothetical protein